MTGNRLTDSRPCLPAFIRGVGIVANQSGPPAVSHPSIVCTPGVCGGEARLNHTRIPVWVLERMRQVGLSEIDILRSYPNLRAADLVQAWSYAESHRAEIERAIRENEN